MRRILMITVTALLGSCMMAPQPMAPSPSGQRALASLLNGKVAGRPVSCLPSYNANDMSIIDGHTVGFRVGTGTTYMMSLSDGCSLLGSGNYALLTKQFGGLGLCSGDIAQVVDTMNHITVGSCQIGPITPYTRPGR